MAGCDHALIREEEIIDPDTKLPHLRTTCEVCQQFLGDDDPEDAK